MLRLSPVLLRLMRPVSGLDPAVLMALLGNLSFALRVLVEIIRWRHNKRGQRDKRDAS